MKVVSNIDNWSESHHIKWLDFIRIFLGLVLILKGIIFVRKSDLIAELLVNNSAQLRNFMFIHYIIGVQLVAGLMITFGLFTRIASLFMIPVLLAGLFYEDISSKFYSAGTELPFLILVLILLVFYSIYGSGPISADHYMKTHAEKDTEGN